MKYSLLFAAVLINATTSASADAYLGTCYFETKGKILVDGECDVFFEEGSEDFAFFARDVKKGNKEYAVKLTTKSGGTGDAVMKDVSRENSKEKSLGTLTRDGRCWTNANVKLCTSEPYK